VTDRAIEDEPLRTVSTRKSCGVVSLPMNC